MAYSKSDNKYVSNLLGGQGDYLASKNNAITVVKSLT